MEDREREAEQHDELELCLGLRPTPSRRCLQLPNPKDLAVVRDDSSVLSLNTRIRSEQELELEAKREAQALRRLEARKKIDDKRKSKGNSLNGNSNETLVWFENRRALGRESEGDYSERRRKGEKRSASGFDSYQLNALPNSVGSDGNGPQSVLEKHSGHVGGGGVIENLKRSVSNCSRGSSPGDSDYQSTSGQGGSSSDGGSHSSHSHPLDRTIKNCTTVSNDTQIRTSSHHESEPFALQPNGSPPPNSSNGKPDCSSSSYQIEPSQTLKNVSSPCHLDRNLKVPAQLPRPHPVTKETKAIELSRPPKPRVQQSNEALAHMPCVITTGNGPNGKRITGFLHKYSKLEVSIVCVCHGTSFSPAGFVEHAGGVGIENPLRHITIAPSSLSR